MSYTNSTPNYNLPQWIGTDKPTFLGDFNGAFSAIDTAMKDNADASSAATSTANAANATAVSANTNANTALNTANTAKDTADAATAAAASATSTANTAKTTADNAAHAALSNNIANLAPAYDPTLTYAVGDLVTYIDQNNTGKLYKCIIAVNTPMAFNVNYWDDVTTSEVYASARKIIAEVAGDGTMTYNEALTTISNALSAYSTDQLKHTRFITQNTGGSGVYYYEYAATRVAADEIRYTCPIVASGATPSVHNVTVIIDLDGTTNHVYSDNHDGASYTRVDQTSEVLSSSFIVRVEMF